MVDLLHEVICQQSAYASDITCLLQQVPLAEDEAKVLARQAEHPEQAPTHYKGMYAPNEVPNMNNDIPVKEV